jgi:hypothetical protein
MSNLAYAIFVAVLCVFGAAVVYVAYQGAALIEEFSR